MGQFQFGLIVGNQENAGHFHNLEHLYRTLAAYQYIFRNDDGVTLNIGLSQEVLNRQERIAGIIELSQQRHTMGQPPRVNVLVLKDLHKGAAVFTEGMNLMLQPGMNSPWELYLAYTNANEQNAYTETDETVDFYDIIHGVLSRKGDDVESSTHIDRLHDYIDFVDYYGDALTSFLDVGCGAGAVQHLVQGFRRHNGLPPVNYHGLDYSRRQILRATRNYPEANFHVGTAAMLPFADNTFDVGVALSVFNLLPTEQIPQAVNEILRVTRLGAFFTVNTQGHRYGMNAPLTIENQGISTATRSHYTGYLVPGPMIDEVLAKYDDKVAVEKDHCFVAIKPGLTMKVMNKDEPKYAELKKFVEDNRQRLQAGGGVVTDDGHTVSESVNYKIYPRQWYEDRFSEVDRTVDNYKYLGF